VRGDQIPYTGQGSNEFGHAPGYMPFKFHRTPTPWGRIGLDSGEIALALFGGYIPASEANDFHTTLMSPISLLAGFPLADLFDAVFGGGASAPIFPPRYYKKSHAPACIFIGAGVGLCADNSHLNYPTGLTEAMDTQSAPPQHYGGRFIRTAEPVCQGQWHEKTSTDAACSPTDPTGNGCTNFCRCYWGCRQCNGTWDLYNNDLDRPNDPGVNIETSAGSTCFCRPPEPPATGCPPSNH